MNEIFLNTFLSALLDGFAKKLTTIPLNPSLPLLLIPSEAA